MDEPRTQPPMSDDDDDNSIAASTACAPKTAQTTTTTTSAAAATTEPLSLCDLGWAASGTNVFLPPQATKTASPFLGRSSFHDSITLAEFQESWSTNQPHQHRNNNNNASHATLPSTNAHSTTSRMTSSSWTLPSASASASWMSNATATTSNNNSKAPLALSRQTTNASLSSAASSSQQTVASASSSPPPHHRRSISLTSTGSGTAASIITTTTTHAATITTTNPNATPRDSALRDEARIGNWDKVYQYCQKFPELAAYRGKDDGWTALHHAGNRRCPYPHVVDALITAYPQALMTPVDSGWLPLHYACRFKAPTAVVKLMVDKMMAMQNNQQQQQSQSQQQQQHHCDAAVSRREALGRTPLYYAVRYNAPPGVVELLVQAHPGAVILQEDSNQVSALSWLWDDWATKKEGRQTLLPYLNHHCEDINSAKPEELRRRFQKDVRLQDRWNKVEMLLRAAFGFSLDDTDKQNDGDDDDNDTGKQNDSTAAPQRRWRMVHATAAIKCHLSLFLMACLLYPEQVRELDEHDLQRPPTSSNTSSSSSSSSGSSGIHSQTALHLAVSRHHRKAKSIAVDDQYAVVTTLLQLYPEACRIADSQGQLPLHRAVQNECQSLETVRAVCDAYPEAVRLADSGPTRRLPLHWAATNMPPASLAADEEDDDDEEQDNNNNTADEPNSVLLQMLQAYPAGAAVPDADGNLPMHLACQSVAHTVWDDTFQALTEAHPAAVRQRRPHDGRLPLHLVCANIDCTGGGTHLVQHLIQRHPAAAQAGDAHGLLPLHIAVDAGKDWLTVLLRAFPDAIHTPDQWRGWYPLHVAAASRHASSPGHDDDSSSSNHHNGEQHQQQLQQQPPSLLRRLLQAHPAAAQVRDTRGRTPLHLACASGHAWASHLAPLHSAFPAAVRVATPLRPYQVLALTPTATSEDDRRLDGLYELIRSDPSVLLL